MLDYGKKLAIVRLPVRHHIVQRAEPAALQHRNRGCHLQVDDAARGDNLWRLVAIAGDAEAEPEQLADNNEYDPEAD